MKSDLNNIDIENWLGQLLLYVIHGIVILECLIMALFKKE
jgi:hypothetical protein